jgi:hypothetical protein
LVKIGFFGATFLGAGLGATFFATALVAAVLTTAFGATFFTVTFLTGAFLTATFATALGVATFLGAAAFLGAPTALVANCGAVKALADTKRRVKTVATFMLTLDVAVSDYHKDGRVMAMMRVSARQFVLM